MDEAWPDRIRCLRAFLAVSQVRFAAIFGTSVVSMNRWEMGHATPSPFHSTIFVLLEYAVLVRPAAEMVRRLENAVGDPEALVCMAVWLACPEGPPASLRESSPDLLPEIGPPSSTPAGPPPC